MAKCYSPKGVCSGPLNCYGHGKCRHLVERVAEFRPFMEKVLKPIPEATPDFVGYIERFPKQ